MTTHATFQMDGEQLVSCQRCPARCSFHIVFHSRGDGGALYIDEAAFRSDLYAQDWGLAADGARCPTCKDLP